MSFSLRSAAQRLGLRPRTGCIRVETPDPRDLRVDALVGSSGPLPRSYSLLGSVVDVLRQANNDCVANALAQAVRIRRVLKGLAPVLPSRRALYAWGREMGGLRVEVDAGMHIPTAPKVAIKWGLPDETAIPYSTPVNRHMPLSAYRSGFDSAGQVKGFYRADEFWDVQRANAADHPVLFGINLESGTWTTPKNGVVEPKAAGRKQSLHCMLAVGYDETHVWVLNSWGKGWGDGGIAYCPHDYFRREAFDMYAVEIS